MSLRLKMFHEANAPLANGHKRNALLEISDNEFERNHGFIQWAFPTPQQSAQNQQAPAVDLEAAIWLAEKPDVTEFMEQMTVRFLEFLAANHHWKRSYNHNHLRISRVIQSLRVLHSWELANWFYEQVKVFAGDDFELMAKSDGYWAYHASPLHDKAAGSFVGLAIGDALGAPVEFSPRGSFEPVTAYRSGGRFKLPAGAWTDDTAMALCLAQSLIAHNGLDNTDLLKRFCDWAETGSNTSTGIAVGIGQNTLRTLGDFRRTGRLEALPFGAKNDGNGSLMRLAPVACFASNDISRARSIAGAQSRATHASQTADECCQFLAELLCRLTRGESFSNVLGSESNSKWRAAISNAFPPNLSEISEADVRSGGYVVDTLHAALWSVQNTCTFKDAVLKAVNLGDDADTTGAVAGQIAGACYGYSSIPKSLKSGLTNEPSVPIRVRQSTG